MDCKMLVYNYDKLACILVIIIIWTTTQLKSMHMFFNLCVEYESYIWFCWPNEYYFSRA